MKGIGEAVFIIAFFAVLYVALGLVFAGMMQGSFLYILGGLALFIGVPYLVGEVRA